MKHLNIKIYGKVQGTGLRYSANKLADKLSVKGFIRNEADGTVYVEAEGEEKALDEFVIWLHKGPMFALVEKVDIEESELKGYNTFEVRY